MEEVLKYNLYDHGLAVLTINRPNKRNAISKEVVSLFAQYITELENNTDIKLLVITGEGQQAFCAGGDLKDFHGYLKADEAFELLKPMQEVLYRIATLPFPTLAWMNGSAEEAAWRSHQHVIFALLRRMGTMDLSKATSALLQVGEGVLFYIDESILNRLIIG